MRTTTTPTFPSGGHRKDYVLEARKILNDNKAYPEGRNLVLSSSSETSLLKNELFIKANERGDGGTALENAELGRILGFSRDARLRMACGRFRLENVTSASALHAIVRPTRAWMDQNVNDIAAGDTTAVTLHEANKFATEAGAAITVYKAHSVKGSYATDYTKGITIDGFTAPLQIGQLVAFGTGGSRHVYTVIESEASGSDRVVWLDRPLEAALADNDPAFPGPAGAMNLAFHRDAIALVTRPLALPNQSMGVMAAVAAYNNIAMRVTMQARSPG